MRIKAYQRFKRCYRNLPLTIQRKADKQIELLSTNFYHPSLRTKKVKGSANIWEARVDLSHE